MNPPLTLTDQVIVRLLRDGRFMQTFGEFRRSAKALGDKRRSCCGKTAARSQREAVNSFRAIVVSMSPERAKLFKSFLRAAIVVTFLNGRRVEI